MKDETVLNILEEAARKLAVRVDYEDLRKGEVNTDGGLFSLKGERRALIHKGLSLKDKVHILSQILAGIDTEGIHLPPEVRGKIEEAKGLLKQP